MTLDSLNFTRNKFLANFYKETDAMTEEQQEGAARYLAQLDCTSVQQAADFACSEFCDKEDT